MLGLKLAAIGTAVGLALGFTAGLKWEKADRYKDAVTQIEAIQVQATDSLAILNSRWEVEAGRVKIQVEDWNARSTLDQDLMKRLLSGQSLIRSRFDEFNNTITITTDLGTCQLSDDAVRLLRQASAAANASTGVPNNRVTVTED